MVAVKTTADGLVRVAREETLRIEQPLGSLFGHVDQLGIHLVLTKNLMEIPLISKGVVRGETHPQFRWLPVFGLNLQKRL